MLLLGTTDHLEDLDRQLTIAEDVSVTAIAVGDAVSAGGARRAYALLDGQRVAGVDEYELAPLGSVGPGKGQSLAVVRGGLLVGLEHAQLAELRLAEPSLAEPSLAIPGRTDAELLAVQPFGMLPGRATWESPAGGEPDLRSIAVTGRGTWLVGVHVGGVWRSDDAGSTWTNAVPADDDVHELRAGGGAVVAAAARGFGWSLDDGVTWQWTTDGLHAPYCRAVAIDDGVAYVTASTGPSTRDGRLFRASLGSAFEPCRGGLPESFPFNLDTGSLAACGDEVALGAPDGQVWRSHDSGETFEMVTERVGRVRVLRFA